MRNQFFVNVNGKNVASLCCTVNRKIKPDELFPKKIEHQLKVLEDVKVLARFTPIGCHYLPVVND